MTAQFTILPPPQVEHPSHDAAEQAIHAWTLDHHYNVTHYHNFRNENNEIIARTYTRDRAGKPKNTRKLTNDERVRPQRGSQRMGCPMRIKIQAVSSSKPQGPWMVCLMRDGGYIHNHPPVHDVRIHVGHRQRASKTNNDTKINTPDDLICVQRESGVSAAKIQETVYQQIRTLSAYQKIYNERSAATREQLSTATVSEALFREPDKNGFHYEYEINLSIRRLRYLLWAYPDTDKRLRDHSDVIVLDCTYKSNVYDLPLLNIIVVTGFNVVLPIAQCWLPGEAQPDFEWALRVLNRLLGKHAIRVPRLILTDRDLTCMNALQSVFPYIPFMVCRWHMNRCVLAKARQVLGQEKVVDPPPRAPPSTKTLQQRTNS